MPVRHTAASTPPIVTAFIYQGIPVLASGPLLDTAAAGALVAAAGTVATSGPVLADLSALAEWTPGGIGILEQVTHAATSRRSIAFVSPPSRLLASVPAAGGFDMFPSAEAAVAILARRPGRLPHPAAGGQPVRFAHRSFGPQAASLYTARHWIRGLLRDWGHTHVIDRVVVAASELASMSAASNSMVDISTYVWRRHGGALMLTTAVADAHPHLAGSHHNSGDDSGLRLVASLAEHLGCYRQHSAPAGKCTWFTIGLARDSH